MAHDKGAAAVMTCELYLHVCSCDGLQMECALEYTCNGFWSMYRHDDGCNGL